jgi:hypothetical protein
VMAVRLARSLSPEKDAEGRRRTHRVGGLALRDGREVGPQLVTGEGRSGGERGGGGGGGGRGRREELQRQLSAFAAAGFNSKHLVWDF